MNVLRMLSTQIYVCCPLSVPLKSLIQLSIYNGVLPKVSRSDSPDSNLWRFICIDLRLSDLYNLGKIRIETHVLLDGVFHCV